MKKYNIVKYDILFLFSALNLIGYKIIGAQAL